LPAKADAQGLTLDDSGSHSFGVYAGVEPGQARNPPAVRRLERRIHEHPDTTILTWPGFTPLGDGGSRFFVQMTRPTVPEMHAEGTRVVLVFRNTSIHVRNSGRWLETRFFNTPVRRARLERRGHDMAFVLYLRAAATPSLSTEPAGNGTFHYVYLDFPAGNYAPVVNPPPGAGPSESPGGPPSAPAREIDPSISNLDDERPPILQGGSN
jgi:hypothetical protein